MAQKLSASIEKKKQVFYPYYIAIVILSFIFYGNSLKNEYSMDDNLVTSTYSSQHPLVEKGIAGIPAIFTSHFVINSKQSYAYRPITTSSFAIEYQFFGQNPMASHLINILLYALTIIVLFRFLNQLWGKEKYVLTILTCLIFLIHPIHTEVVNNIKSRDEILSFLFGLISMNHALNYFDRKKLYSIILSILFLVLSLLSKRTGMIFIAVLPLTLYYFRSINIKKLGLAIGCMIIGFATYRLMDKMLLNDPVARVKYYFENPLFYENFSARIPMFFYSNYYYLALMLVPYPLRYYYGYDQVPIADWSSPIVYVMLVLMVLIVGISLIRIQRKEIWTYSILFYFLAIGGACNLLFPAVGIIAERFAFIASLGFCILIGYGVYYFFFRNADEWLTPEKKSRIIVTRLTFVLSIAFIELFIITQLLRNSNYSFIIAFVLISVLGIYFRIFPKKGPKIKPKNISYLFLFSLSFICCIYVINRNKAWKTDVSLYKNDIENLDRSLKAHNMLAQAYYKESMVMLQNNQPIASYIAKVDSAEMLFKKCIEIYDGYAVTYNNLGALCYTFRQQEDTAYYYFNKAIELDSNYTEALYNLGNIESNRFYSFYYLNTYASGTQDSTNNSDQFSSVVEYHDQLMFIGKTLLNLKKVVPSIINQSGNQSKSQQDFLVNIKNNVLGTLTNLNVIEYFDQNEFNEKFLTNGQAIIDSYESGFLNQHLFNFIAQRITEGILKEDANLSNLSNEIISDYCGTHMLIYKDLFLDHMTKCIELTPSYYAAFQSLNKYYYDMLDYDKIIEFNLMIVETEAYPYNYEFYNNAAKGYYFNSDYVLCKEYLELTIKEIDRYLTDEPEQGASLTQYRQGVINQLELINQKLNTESSSLQ